MIYKWVYIIARRHWHAFVPFTSLCPTDYLNSVCLALVSGQIDSPYLIMSWITIPICYLLTLPMWLGTCSHAGIPCMLYKDLFSLITHLKLGGYSWEFVVGLCRTVVQILILFQTEKSHFPHPSSDLAEVGSLADIFPIFDPLFAFFPHCGAWSQTTIFLSLIW